MLIKHTDTDIMTYLPTSPQSSCLDPPLDRARHCKGKQSWPRVDATDINKLILNIVMKTGVTIFPFFLTSANLIV